jgi:hypothetical protein
LIAETWSRRQDVLVNHTGETIATLDTRLATRRRHRRTCRAGRRETQRSVWPVAVEMFHEDVEDALERLVVQDQQPVEPQAR